MDARRYLITTISAATALVVAVAALNLAADPLGTFGTTRIEGFNALKPTMNLHERAAKLNAPALEGARALVLGTSRAAIGIDPGAVADGFPNAYNLAFGAQSLHETRLVLETLGPRLAGLPVVVGLDFFAANAYFDRDPGNAGRILAKARWRVLAGIALSLDTAGASIETITGQDPSAIRDAGLIFTDRGHHRWNAAYVARRGGPGAMFDASERSYARDFYFPPPARRFAWRHGGRDSCADLQAIFETARRHGIRLVAFVSPSHARQWDLVDALGLWTEFERFKWIVASTNERAAAGAPAYPVLDFAGHFPEVSLPPPSATTAIHDTHWDSSHYREALGTIAVERAGRAERAARGSFGARIETATMNEHLGQLRALRTQWRAAYPAEHARVRATALSFRPATAAIIPPEGDGARTSCAVAPEGP